MFRASSSDALPAPGKRFAPNAQRARKVQTIASDDPKDTDQAATARPENQAVDAASQLSQPFPFLSAVLQEMAGVVEEAAATATAKHASALAQDATSFVIPQPSMESMHASGRGGVRRGARAAVVEAVEQIAIVVEREPPSTGSAVSAALLSCARESAQSSSASAMAGARRQRVPLPAASVAGSTDAATTGASALPSTRRVRARKPLKAVHVAPSLEPAAATVERGSRRRRAPAIAAPEDFADSRVSESAVEKPVETLALVMARAHSATGKRRRVNGTHALLAPHQPSSPHLTSHDLHCLLRRITRLTSVTRREQDESRQAAASLPPARDIRRIRVLYTYIVSLSE